MKKLCFLGLLVLAGCDPIYLIEPGLDETGTVHEGPITASEVWRAADNPHRVTGQVTVAGPGSPTLRIEPGAQVLFGRGASLHIGTDALPGLLEAAGTRGDPIELMSERQFQSHGYWAALHFGPMAGPSRLEHVTIRDCGGTADWPQACLRIFGSNEGRPHPVLRHVTIAFSSGFGVVAVAGTGFGEGSEGLSVVSVRDYLVRIGADKVHTLPTFTRLLGDREPAVQVATGVVRQSTRWRAIGMPYVVTTPVRVGGVDEPVLELESGVELQFGRDGEVLVGMDEPGALVAEGTANAPVTFTTPDRTPRGWKGVTFGPHALRESIISQAILEYGGYPNGYSVANISFFADIGPVLRNSVIRHSSGCGVVRLGFGGSGSTDFTDPSLGNQFSDNARGAQCTTG